MARMQDLLLNFASGGAGKEFLRGIAYTALVATDEQTLKRVDPYLKETRKALAQ